VADLPIPELGENRRRWVAMLSPDVPALSREEALELLELRKSHGRSASNLQDSEAHPSLT